MKRDSSSSPVIALVDRGDCFFIEKASNAEKAGAAALIVADDRDEALVTMVTFPFFSRESGVEEGKREKEKERKRLTFFLPPLSPSRPKKNLPPPPKKKKNRPPPTTGPTSPS